MTADFCFEASQHGHAELASPILNSQMNLSEAESDDRLAAKLCEWPDLVLGPLAALTR